MMCVECGNMCKKKYKSDEKCGGNKKKENNNVEPIHTHTHPVIECYAAS